MTTACAGVPTSAVNATYFISGLGRSKSSDVAPVNGNTTLASSATEAIHYLCRDTGLFDYGPDDNAKVACPEDSEIDYFTVDKTKMSATAMKALPCQTAATCLDTLNGWEATGVGPGFQVHGGPRPGEYSGVGVDADPGRPGSGAGDRGPQQRAPPAAEVGHPLSGSQVKPAEQQFRVLQGQRDVPPHPRVAGVLRLGHAKQHATRPGRHFGRPL